MDTERSHRADEPSALTLRADHAFGSAARRVRDDTAPLAGLGLGPGVPAMIDGQPKHPIAAHYCISEPGGLIWRTPAGRRYTTTPAVYQA